MHAEIVRNTMRASSVAGICATVIVAIAFYVTQSASPLGILAAAFVTGVVAFIIAFAINYLLATLRVRKLLKAKGTLDGGAGE